MTTEAARQAIIRLRGAGRERQEEVRARGARQVQWEEGLRAGLPEDDEGLAWFAAAHGLTSVEVEELRRWSK
jgi:ribose 1,5-bisphosphokinase PhnN